MAFALTLYMLAALYEVHVERPYVRWLRERFAAPPLRTASQSSLAAFDVRRRPVSTIVVVDSRQSGCLSAPVAPRPRARAAHARCSGPSLPDVRVPHVRGLLGRQRKEARQSQFVHEPRDVGRGLIAGGRLAPARRAAGPALSSFRHGLLGPLPRRAEGCRAGAGRRLRRRGVSRRAHRARRRRVALGALRWLCSAV